MCWAWLWLLCVYVFLLKYLRRRRSIGYDDALTRSSILFVDVHTSILLVGNACGVDEGETDRMTGTLRDLEKRVYVVPKKLQAILVMKYWKSESAVIFHNGGFYDGLHYFIFL